MRLFRNIDDFAKSNLAENGIALAIGNFDGVHLGHQEILQRLKAQKDLMKVVMIFEPHPIEFFAKNNPKITAVARLMNFRDKYNAFKDFGIDVLLALRFDQKFADISKEEFIDILVNKLKVKHLIVGDDFRFAKNRSGDFSFLSNQMQAHKVVLEKSPTFAIDEERVSSTAIRKYLEQSDFQKVKQYLGKGYSISGKVVTGKKLGRTIGFRTANINLKRLKSAVSGVYAVKVTISGQIFNGICNIGNRPTINTTKPLLEVHIFDFNQDIYGKYVKVELIDHIRNEMKFSSLDELKNQIATDVLKARAILE